MAFSHLLGNEIVKRTLSHMLECRRVPHTLLFCGPEGVGKRIFAQSLTEALMGPASQHKIKLGNHPDLHQVYPEGKGSLHPVENIRALIQEASYPPFEAPIKMFFVHDAHQMLPASSNALLKTLEEPHENTYFILMTNQPDAMLPTLLSRCCKIPFFPIPEPQIEHYVKEYGKKNEREAKRIAFLSQGSFARAYALIHQKQETTYASQALAREFTTLSLPREYPRFFSLCDTLEALFTHSDEEDTTQGESISFRMDHFLEEIFAWYRDLYLLKSNPHSEKLYHYDAIDLLKKNINESLPSLEVILTQLISMRTAFERHVKIRVALEQFLIDIFVNLNGS